MVGRTDAGTEKSKVSTTPSAAGLHIRRQQPCFTGELVPNKMCRAADATALFPKMAFRVRTDPIRMSGANSHRYIGRCVAAW